MSRRIAILLVASTAVLTAAVPIVLAQPQPAAEADEMVQLNFPQEIEVKILVDYVSQRLKIKILYDDVIANKRLVVRAPEAIPASSLLAVLESCLKMKGLIMVEADAPGWKRIVAVNRLQNVAPFGDPQEVMEEHGRGTPVTQAFVLKHAAEGVERLGVAALVRAELQHRLAPRLAPEFLRPLYPAADLLDRRFDVARRDRQPHPPVGRVVHARLLVDEVRQRAGEDLSRVGLADIGGKLAEFGGAGRDFGDHLRHPASP